MRFAVDEESRREVAAALHVEDIGFAFRRFGLTRVTKRKRVRTEGCREHAQRQPGEVLLERGRRTRWRPCGATPTFAARPARPACGRRRSALCGLTRSSGRCGGSRGGRRGGR